MKLRKETIVAAGWFALFVFAMQISAAGQTDKSIDEFWVRFKSAVAKQDKNSIATMSQFPIAMPYGVPKIRNRAQLTRRYRDLFTVQTNAAKCFAEAQPMIDSENANRFTVGCKDQAGNEVIVYGFRRFRAGWKLVSLDNINE